MMPPFLTDVAKDALRDAVQSVEAKSAAEVVIAVRPESGDYRFVDANVALIAWVLGSAFVLFSPIPFRTFELFFYPLVLSALGFFLSRLGPLRRVFTSSTARRIRAERAAHAAFYERGVMNTTGRTGLLVFVALFEREVVVLWDRGLDAAQMDAEFGERIAELERCLHDGESATGLARRIRALRGPLSLSSPRRADDVNELPDGVHT